jgi:hypothetical protein
VAYADAVSSFREIVENTPTPNAYSHLQSLEQEKTCHIAQAADLCIMLTRGLNESQNVFKQRGRVSNASHSDVSFISLSFFNPFIFHKQLTSESPKIGAFKLTPQTRNSPTQK